MIPRTSFSTKITTGLDAKPLGCPVHALLGRRRLSTVDLLQTKGVAKAEKMLAILVMLFATRSQILEN